MSPHVSPKGLGPTELLQSKSLVAHAIRLLHDAPRSLGPERVLPS